jgi:ABC-type uncharacterized transport system YnjBCD substrate-binding protein
MSMTFIQFLNEVNMEVDMQNPKQSAEMIRRASKKDPSVVARDQMRDAKQSMTDTAKEQDNTPYGAIQKQIARKRLELAQLQQRAAQMKVAEPQNPQAQQQVK